MPTAFDLGFDSLPKPDVIETLDVLEIFNEMLEDLKKRDPIFNALVESDPAYKILEVAAFREMLIRQRVNDGSRANMMLYATGSDLDNLGAFYKQKRKIVKKGDPDATPPVLPEYESDDVFRARLLLSLDGYTTAGSINAYKYHSFNADVKIRDVAVIAGKDNTGGGGKDERGYVKVYILNHDGIPKDDTTDKVELALNKEEVRPLTDYVHVFKASLANFKIDVYLTVDISKSIDETKRLSEISIRDYVERNRNFGRKITLSGIIAAAHVAGVISVKVNEPTGDISPTQEQSANLTDLTIAAGYPQ